MQWCEERRGAGEGRESARARLEAPVFAGGHDPSRVHVVHDDHHLVAAREPARLGVVAERGAPCCIEFEERHPSRHQHNKMSLAECSRVIRERQRNRPLVQPDCMKLARGSRIEHRSPSHLLLKRFHFADCHSHADVHQVLAVVVVKLLRVLR